MAKSLVVVESPAKSKTIGKILGRNYTIKASMGHVIDLPKSKIGVNLEGDFEPEYGVIKGKGKVLKELRDAAAKVDNIYLAMDPDREGEAIAWHIQGDLQKKFKGAIRRVTFNEITKTAIKEAFNNIGDVDMDKVNAQQARRILDRVVGYKVSPFLWKSVGRGLSAGRVQSVCVRLICEREEEIKAFVPEESWNITAHLIKPEGKQKFTATLDKVSGKKAALKKEDDAKEVLKALEGASYVVSDIKKREKKRKADAPFITSTLQQRAAYKLGFSASKTMMVAQQLYEGLNLGDEGTVGLITYMRTDSYRISNDAADEAASYVEERFGKDYLPASRPVYGKKKKNTQDAHEAIRPSSVMRDPQSLKDKLEKDQFRLYELIWTRFVQSQMAPAVFDGTTVIIKAGDYDFKATGSVIKFPGYLALDKEVMSQTEKEDTEGKKDDAGSTDEKLLPKLEVDEALDLEKLEPSQHFTKPPARYSEATLVKALEEHGIGRPSTYAPTIKTIQDRFYVEKLERRFHPTALGVRVNDILVKFFPDLFNVNFTAQMEELLDQVADGDKEWVSVLKDFYKPFEKTLDTASEKMKELKAQVIETDEKCEKCGSTMIIKAGRYGDFMACSNYPECKNTKDIGDKDKSEEENQDHGTCENCSEPMVLKTGRFGKFLACSAYPKCKTTKAFTTSANVDCPEEGCDGKLLERRSRKGGRRFWGCSKYPDCTHISNTDPSKKKDDSQDEN